MNRLLLTVFTLALAGSAFAQQTNVAVKTFPPAGIAVADSDRHQLEAGLAELGKAIADLKKSKDKFAAGLLPDVLIYHKAVDYALRYNEFYSVKEIASAKILLKTGLSRAKELQAKTASWTNQKGEVVRGYISKIDGSVQPYGLTVPDNYDANGPAFNLSTWYHGRGDKLTDLAFIANGKGFAGSMPAMKNTIMLYPYGRFCNAYKFAGEVDVLEALDEVEKLYKINPEGLVDRGFSMGGAAAWQFAVHYPDLWLAANPGAGFSETQNFMSVYGKEELHPTWYQRKLWHMYDCTDYASNLSNLPLFAYNGDKDPQKQAADMMEAAMKTEGLNLNRTTGINMGHGYTKTASATVDSLLSIAQSKGKNPPPAEIHFTTYTLKYNQYYWLTIDGLAEHWAKARVDGSLKNNIVTLKTENITAFTIDPSQMAGVKTHQFTFDIDGSKMDLTIGHPLGAIRFHRVGGKWVVGKVTDIAKVHNLQGPIDDAFMSAFIVVKPSGNSKNVLFDKWSKAEMARFIAEWRGQFRGDAVVKADKDITPADMASANLILFGDAASNSVIAKLNNQLPIKWAADGSIKAGADSYQKDYGLVMICPNPLNPKKYVVLNSGFTFREDANGNNSKQISVLPDWAIIDLKTPPGPVYPGGITNAGFFNEHWQWKTPEKE